MAILTAARKALLKKRGYKPASGGKYRNPKTGKLVDGNRAAAGLERKGRHSSRSIDAIRKRAESFDPSAKAKLKKPPRKSPAKAASKKTAAKKRVKGATATKKKRSVHDITNEIDKLIEQRKSARKQLKPTAGLDRKIDELFSLIDGF